MERKMIGGKAIDQWIEAHPVLRQVMAGKEAFWFNPRYSSFEAARGDVPLSAGDIQDAEDRLKRFAPYIERAFPDTRETGGIIESPLVRIPAMQTVLEKRFGRKMQGALLLKCDSHLPVSGSIKARGGIYEVLKHAEDLAVENGRLDPDENYGVLDSDAFRDFFSGYAIAVGSTGNLGLSIGIMGAQLGFEVVVHMSADAKPWKKDLLREKGARVVEYASDYSRAVEAGREEAARNPRMHFVDDENSTDLFLGYAAAASRLKRQLAERGVAVDEDHPLFVYLPCGVGGGPGGITFGLKQVFGDHVHCFFAEPTASPCMMLGLMTRLHERVNVRDFGLDNVTDADGLAVASPSGFVGKALERSIRGVYTVEDDRLYELLRMIRDTEKIALEPSALAGMPGPFMLAGGAAGRPDSRALRSSNAAHIVWATGGSMVPEDVMAACYDRGAG